MPFTGATIPAPAPSGISGGMAVAPSYYSEEGVNYTYGPAGQLVPVVDTPAPVSSISAAAPTPAPAGFGGGLQADPGWAGSLAGGVYNPTPVNPVADLVKTNPDAAIAKALEGPQLVTYYNELKNQAASDPSFAKQYGSKIEGLKNIIDTTAYSIAEQGGQGISAGQMAILKPLDPAILAQAKEAAKTAGEEGSTSFRGANGQLYTVTADQNGNIQSISIPKSQGDWIATAQKDWLQANWDASGKANPTGLSNKGNSFFGGLFSGISDIGKSIDDLVHEIPGDWATVGALAGGYLASPGAAGAGSAGAGNGAWLGTFDDIAAVDALNASEVLGLGAADFAGAADASAGLGAGLDALAADNIDIGGGYNPATGMGDPTTAAAAAATGVTSSAGIPYGASGMGATLTGLAPAAAGAGAGAGAGLASLSNLAKAALVGSALLGPQQRVITPEGVDQTPVGGGLSPAYQPYRYKPYAAGGEVGGLSAAAQRYNLGGYSDGGRLLRGPGDGVSDSIPATIGAKKQPARLADGEFVVPARIVSELGNGSTEAGARKLYAMMDRIQAARKKSVGKGKVAVNSRADKYLPK